MKKRNNIAGIVGVLLLSTACRASDANLTLVRKDVPPASNAYTLWTNALPRMELPENDGLDEAFKLAYNLTTNMPEGEARNQLDAWLDSKKEPLALLSQGISLGQLQLPAFGVENIAEFYISNLFQAARMKIVVARMRVEKGQYAEAARECQEVVKVGQLIISGDGAIIHYLVGTALQSMGLNGIRWLASQDDIPVAVLSGILRDLPISDEMDSDLAQIYRVELTQFTAPLVIKFEREATSPANNFPIPITSVLDVTNTLFTAEAFYTRLVKNALGTWPDRDKTIKTDIMSLVTIPNVDEPDLFLTSLMWWGQKPSRETAKKWKQLKKLARKQSNVLGKLLVGLTMEVCDDIYESSVKARTEVNLTRAFVAVQSFRQHFGTWPDSLADVRSKGLLADDPIDLFAIKPVQYSRANGILWSVGPDQKDDGGDPEKDFIIKLPNQVPAER